MTVKHDPANYRAMCEPHASQEASQDAVNAFFDDVAAARKAHRIKDVVLLVECNVILSDGQEGVVTAASHCGAFENNLPMLARAYGAARAALNNLLDTVARGR